jgi:hypothetical protein
MAPAEARRAYRQGTLNCRSNGLIPNRPVRILMVPPEHHDQARPWVVQLQRLLRAAERPGQT